VHRHGLPSTKGGGGWAKKRREGKVGWRKQDLFFFSCRDRLRLMRTVSGVVAALTYASLLLLLLRSPFSPLFALLCRLLFSVFFFFLFAFSLCLSLTCSGCTSADHWCLQMTTVGRRQSYVAALQTQKKKKWFSTHPPPSFLTFLCCCGVCRGFALAFEAAVALHLISVCDVGYGDFWKCISPLL
jgi:hypothetical protein